MSEFSPDVAWWVTGLTDGEGCFFAYLHQRLHSAPSGQSYTCLDFDAGYQLALRGDDLAAVQEVHRFFGCGKVRWKKLQKNHPQALLLIRKVDDLLNVVIPHFEQYPLHTKKGRDFILWKQVIEYYASQLSHRKQIVRRYPDKIATVLNLCEKLKVVRNFSDPNKEAICGI
ncbi:MAG: LAGLIDADG family homing endonuclease [Methanoregula sp.]|nr:LAGLIDADG family homing endonuclease [Methanoregula sp.]